MMTIAIKNPEDRRIMAGILAANGYMVWIESIKKGSQRVTVLRARKPGEEAANE